MRNVFYILFLALYLGCNAKKNTRCANAIFKAELKKRNGIIDISKFDKIKWDKLYIIIAYQTDQNFDETLLRYEDEIEETGIAHREDFGLILLFNGKELVSFSNVDFRDISFGGAYKEDKNYRATPYIKKDAVFNYQTRSDGFKYIPKKVLK